MEGEREGEKHQCVVASRAPPTGDVACNPGMCPDWESNKQPSASQVHAQPTELPQPGLINILLNGINDQFCRWRMQSSTDIRWCV